MKLSIYDGKATDKKEWSFAHGTKNGLYWLSAVDSKTGEKITNLLFIDYSGLVIVPNAKSALERQGYDTSAIAWSDDRIKIYGRDA